MKQVLILILSIFGTFQMHLFAQTDPVTISRGTAALDKVQRPAITLIMADADAASFAKAWRSHLSKEHKLRTRERRGLISATETNFPAVSDQTMDFYTIVRDQDAGIRVDVIISFGYDMFLQESNFPEEYRRMEQMLLAFAKTYLQDSYNQSIKSKEKALKSLEKDVSKMRKSTGKLESSINKDTKAMDKLLKRLDSNKAKLDEETRLLPDLEQSLRLKQQRLLELQQKLRSVQ